MSHHAWPWPKTAAEAWGREISLAGSGVSGAFSRWQHPRPPNSTTSSSPTSSENLTARPRTPHRRLPSLPQMIANEISAATWRVGEQGFPLPGQARGCGERGHEVICRVG